MIDQIRGGKAYTLSHDLTKSEQVVHYVLGCCDSKEWLSIPQIGGRCRDSLARNSVNLVVKNMLEKGYVKSKKQKVLSKNTWSTMRIYQLTDLVKLVECEVE